MEVCTEKGKQLLKDAEKEGYVKTKAPNPKGLEIRANVITSYSIHYTKLYELLNIYSHLQQRKISN